MFARKFFCLAFAVLLLATPAAAELSPLWRTCTGKPDVDWQLQGGVPPGLAIIAGGIDTAMRCSQAGLQTVEIVTHCAS